MSKPLWTILLILTGILSLWRGGIAAWNLIEYNRLGPEIEAQVTHFELIPKGSKYALKVRYNYSYGGKTYTSSTTLSKPYYLNKASAEAEVKKFSGMPWTGWVDAKSPGYSSLEQKFPLKETFYGLCSLGIFLYFLYLKIHLDILSKALL